jgi:dTDP-4-dehydrorhamnose reductase
VTLGLDRRPGIFHATSSGVTTWFGLVREVLALVGADPERVKPIRTADRDDPAPRPAYSVLDNMALRLSGLPALPDWRESLARLVPVVRAQLERERAAA